MQARPALLLYEKHCFSDDKSTPSLWETQHLSARVGSWMCLLVSQCACAVEKIARLASGFSRVMQDLLVALLIPLCQCHKKHHQSLETG